MRILHVDSSLIRSSCTDKFADPDLGDPQASGSRQSHTITSQIGLNGATSFSSSIYKDVSSEDDSDFEEISGESDEGELTTHDVSEAEEDIHTNSTSARSNSRLNSSLERRYPHSPFKHNFTARYATSAHSPANAIEVFLKVPKEDFEGCDPVAWWALNARKFPNLVHLARDIMTIPGKSLLFASKNENLTNSITRMCSCS